MSQSFKYLRILTAVSLLLSVVIGFALDIISQSKAGFDGPLAHYMSYAFRINKIILAALLSVALLSDFQLRSSFFNKTVLQILGTICVILSMIGFGYLIMQHYSMGSYWSFAELYLFQTAYLLISLVVVGKGRKAEGAQMSSGGSFDE